VAKPPDRPPPATAGTVPKRIGSRAWSSSSLTRSERRALKEPGVEAIVPEPKARAARWSPSSARSSRGFVQCVLECHPEVPRVRTVFDGRAERVRGSEVSLYIRRLEDEPRLLQVRTGVHLMTSASGVVTAAGAPISAECGAAPAFAELMRHAAAVTLVDPARPVAPTIDDRARDPGCR
jgi:hypothetical protein